MLARLRVLVGALVLGGAAACRGPKGAGSAGLEESCKTTIAPRPRSTAPPAPLPPPPASSRIIANVDMKLAPLTSELEKSVPRRVAEERGKDIGIAGRLDYFVDRGPFTTSIENESVVVRTELRGHAEACAKGRCYASCDPILVATSSVPLRLTPAFGFSPSRVTVAFTRGCTIKALGGLVSIDVTPTIQSQLGPALRQVERQIDAKLPRPRPQAERLWKELSTPRPLPLGACMIVAPKGIAQGPMTGDATTLHARFALAATPELRTRCGDAPPATPLPPLGHDPRLPVDDDLVVALVWPLAKAASSISGGEPFTYEGARVRAASASVVAAGADVELDLALLGEACGQVSMRATPVWAEDGKTVVLGGPRVPPPVSPEALKALIPELASALSDPTIDLRAKVRESNALGAHARGDDLVATVRVRGAVDIVQR